MFDPISQVGNSRQIESVVTNLPIDKLDDDVQPNRLFSRLAGGVDLQDCAEDASVERYNTYIERRQGDLFYFCLNCDADK
jgi:hypothetical protein